MSRLRDRRPSRRLLRPLPEDAPHPFDDGQAQSRARRIAATLEKRPQADLWRPAGLGHNGGPPLEDEPPGKLLLVRHCWKKAHEAAWRAPSRDIALFRLRRAEAAGLGYREYMLELLDTGRHPQARSTPEQPET